MAIGFVGLPPGARGYLVGEQSAMNQGAHQLGMLGNMIGIRGALSEQALRDEQIAARTKLSLSLSSIPEIANHPVLSTIAKTKPEALLPLVMPKQQGDTTVAPGHVVLGPDGKPKFSAPFAPKEAPISDLARLLRDRDALPPGDPNRTFFDAKIKLLTSREPQPSKTFENENRLRDDYTTASKPFVALRDAYNTVRASLSGPITAASTLAGATKFMKLIDPESVVRESELSLALRSTGMFDRFMNIQNTIAMGQVLTPSQVQDISKIAESLYGAAEKQQARTDAYFSGLATEYGLEPRRVIRDHRAVMRDAPTPAPTPSPAPAKTIKRTGTLNGRKVIEYTDGTVEYGN